MNIAKARTTMLAFLAAGAVAAVPALAQSTAPQRQGEQREVKLRELPKDGKTAQLKDLVGKPVPDFTLQDTEGKTHTLSDYLEDGKIVVLEWFNAGCPYVVRHYNEGNETMKDTAAAYEDKGVVWLAVATGHTADAEANQEARENWKMPYPVLMDTTGDVGHAYGSKNTPTMYIIHTNGTLAYGGGIDDDARGNKDEPVNHVAKALDELLAGSNVTTSFAEPYGCSVKYKK